MSRELMTFSKAFWELSGRIAGKDRDVDVGMADVDACVCKRLTEDKTEAVRGLFEGRIDGPAPDERLGEPLGWLIKCGPAKLTLALLPVLGRVSGLPIDPPRSSSDLIPSSEALLRIVLTELVEIRRLRLRPTVTSRSSDR